MLTFSDIQTEFQGYVAQNSFDNLPIELYEPANYILSLGGKRIRPILLLLSYNLYQKEIQTALPAAYAIEIFHNFSLLHDDIMDEAPLRRGKPTVHIKYDTNTGILSGDMMLIYAYHYLMQAEVPNANTKIQIVEIFNRFAIEVCEGQQFDMNFENRWDVQIKEYLNMIRLKTAVLLGGALQIGALAGGASEADALHLEAFGVNLGIAFQLQDDILDTFGDPEKFGKKVGGDIVQNKKTYLLIKTLELADPDQKKALFDLMENEAISEEEKVAKVKELYNDLNIRELAEKLQREYTDTAFEHLQKVEVETAKKQELTDLANNLLQREN